MKGTALIKSFLAEHGMDMRRLFNTSLDSRRVALRAKLIRLLYEDGLNKSEISRVLEVNIGTVRYWLAEKVRRDKIRARRANHARRARRKLYHIWEECAQAMEARA